jgi:hypothetical protein
MGFGEIFGSSWEEYKKNFRVFTIILILLSFIPAILLFVISIPFTLEYLSLGDNPTFSEIMSVYFSYKYLPVFIFSIIAYLLGLWVSASFIYNSLYRKKEMSVKETLAGGKKYFWKYFGLDILISLIAFLLIVGPIIIAASLIAIATILIFMGFLLIVGFFVLLVYLGISWIFASYILVKENKGIIESMKMSESMIKGSWWKVLGYLLLFGLIIIGISLAFGFVSWAINNTIEFPYMESQVSQEPSVIIATGIVGQIFDFLASLIVAPLAVLFLKNFYLDMKNSRLKRRRDG